MAGDWRRPRDRGDKCTLPTERRAALLPAHIAATDEAAVRALDRGAPAGLSAAWRARERGGDGNAEHEPGAPPRFAPRHPANFHGSIRGNRPLRLGKPHGMMARPGLAVAAGHMQMLGEVLLRILGTCG
jgi:hypothetical protein